MSPVVWSECELADSMALTLFGISVWASGSAWTACTSPDGGFTENTIAPSVHTKKTSAGTTWTENEP